MCRRPSDWRLIQNDCRPLSVFRLKSTGLHPRPVGKLRDMLRLRTASLLPRLFVAALISVFCAPAHAAVIAAFDNGRYVDTDSARPDAESDNVRESSKRFGHSINRFTKIDPTGLRSVLDNSDVLLIPELEVRELAPDLDAEALSILRDFVGGGGGLVVRAEELVMNSLAIRSVENDRGPKKGKSLCPLPPPLSLPPWTFNGARHGQASTRNRPRRNSLSGSSQNVCSLLAALLLPARVAALAEGGQPPLTEEQAKAIKEAAAAAALGVISQEEEDAAAKGGSAA